MIAVDSEGNTIKSMGTAEALWRMERGCEYIFVATVSKHETYEGAKTTMVKRAAKLEELEMAA